MTRSTRPASTWRDWECYHCGPAHPSLRRTLDLAHFTQDVDARWSLQGGRLKTDAAAETLDAAMGSFTHAAALRIRNWDEFIAPVIREDIVLSENTQRGLASGAINRGMLNLSGSGANELCIGQFVALVGQALAT